MLLHTLCQGFKGVCGEGLPLKELCNDGIVQSSKGALLAYPNVIILIHLCLLSLYQKFRNPMPIYKNSVNPMCTPTLSTYSFREFSV